MSSAAASSPAGAALDSGPTPVPSGLARWRVNWAFTLLEAILWAWSIIICVPYWQNDPNYTYGWAVPALMFFFLWRRLAAQNLDFWETCGREGSASFRLNPWLLAVVGLALVPLEVLREEYQQSGIVLWGINLAKVVFSMAGALWLGGRRLWVLTTFPLLFFLTAVPWPAKIAWPVQTGLQFAVSNTVSEMLLWLGVPVEMRGAVLHLSKGPVGIAEACSGVRSLQSGLMVSLTAGELFWISRRKRWAVVIFGIVVALVSNLARTFTLCWVMEKEGSDAMHRIHDFAGDVAMYSLYGLIFAFAWWIGRGSPDLLPAKGVGTWSARVSRLSWAHVPDFRPLLAVTVGAFVTVHAWYLVLERQARPQTKAQFTPRIAPNSGNENVEFDKIIFARLGATTGEQVRRKVAEAPLGEASGYHLFWGPGPLTKTALHHRPDVCMPGQGWKQEGEVGSLTVTMDGVPLKFLLFHFTSPQVNAVQVWGVWRNGQPVEFDYSDRLTALPEKYGFLPSNRHMLGVELLSCFIPYPAGSKPPDDLAARLLPLMFGYQPFQPPP